MDLGLGQGDRDPQQAPAAIRSDPDGRENGCVADDAVDPDFLVAGVKDEIADLRSHDELSNE